MELNEATKQVYIETAKALKGYERRVFMARVVQALGQGGQRRAARELGWNRTTIRKGQHELASGLVCLEAYAGRGRKRAEEHLPHLLGDIQEIVDGQSQTDPRFESSRLYTRLSAAQVRHQLMAQKGYREAELPTEETIRVKLNHLGYRLHTVRKNVSQKIEETDAIFEHLAAVHQQTREDKTILRLSIDAKAMVKIGPFSRHGQSRLMVNAADHDFKAKERLTPWGICLPDQDRL